MIHLNYIYKNQRIIGINCLNLTAKLINILIIIYLIFNSHFDYNEWTIHIKEINKEGRNKK
jgi:hypothetical protein